MRFKVTYASCDDEVEDLIQYAEYIDRCLNLPGWENTKADINDLLIRKVFIKKKINKAIVSITFY